MYLVNSKQTLALPVTPPPRWDRSSLLAPQNRPSQSGSVELWAAVSHVGFVYMRLIWTHWFIHHCNLIRGWMLMAQTSFQLSAIPPPLHTQLSFSDLSRAFCKYVLTYDSWAFISVTKHVIRVSETFCYHLRGLFMLGGCSFIAHNS